MAKNKAGVLPEYSSKKVPDPVPVAPCQGWTDECEFCEKRFNKWEDASEEVLAKVPSKPGIFEIALKNNKNVQEVVDIVLEPTDLQRAAYSHIDSSKNAVADKKSKNTKSAIVCRWMTFKTPNDKDVVSLCAHWYNNAVLPRMVREWPGLDVLERSDAVAFCDKVQKWCYPQKEAFWRKPKTPPTKIAEVVPGCNWKGPCDICDYYFDEWRQIADVVSDEIAPTDLGVYMLGVKYGKTVETINILYDYSAIHLEIKKSIEGTSTRLGQMLRRTKYHGNSSVSFVVRWLTMSNVHTDSSCFLFAHWLNADRMPEMNFDLPGKKQLERCKSFVVRNHDKKWCDEIEIFKQMKKSKSKDKKEIMLDLKDHMKDLDCSEY